MQLAPMQPVEIPPTECMSPPILPVTDGTPEPLPALADGTPRPIALSISGASPPPIPSVATPTRRRRAPALVPGSRIGPWRIERELGRGGMATVYSVVHTRFGKRAALKLVHDGILGPQFTRETFLREAKIANLVDHAGVTEVFATGSYAGRPYLVMERLRGRSLGALLADEELPRDTAIDILLELCEALGAAHAAGVVHGDLKVDNVFVLDEPGAAGKRIKLLDWGISRIAGEADPLRGIIAGTLTYVAPEQIRCEEITPAADIYSLGVLAYRLLLGEPPFTAEIDLDLLRKHLCGVPPSPRATWPTIPDQLEAALLAMLAKQPADRPALADIAAALRAVRDQPRPAPPPAPAPRRWFAARSRPADAIGRPMLATRPGRAQRAAGAALGVALVVASLVQLLGA
jgi:serine/threonine-protein kinase